MSKQSLITLTCILFYKCLYYGLNSYMERKAPRKQGVENSLTLIEVNPSEPLGAQVRQRWDEIFSPGLERIRPGDIQFLPTGIGGAPLINADIPIRIHEDGSKIPPYIDLKEIFGRVPKILTLTASATYADDVLGLVSLAREYKNQGVERIIVQLTSIAHERQDHKFTNEQGETIRETVTLEAVASLLASPYVRTSQEGCTTVETIIDAGMIVQSHSEELSSMTLKFGIPILQIDAFDYLAEASGIGALSYVYILGPDKGRRRFGQKMAEKFGTPHGSAVKIRNRKTGEPTVTIPTEILKAIKSMGENGATVVIFDDEIREGGTMGAIADALQGYASNIIICSTKSIFSGNAIANLDKSLITRIFLTDAVRPLKDISKIIDKIQWIPLWPGLEQLNLYLQQHLSEPDNSGWLSPAQTGTLLKLSDE